MTEKEKGSVLQFAPFQSAVDEGFWHRLSSLKLNKFGIDDFPIPITGFYAPCTNSRVSNHLSLIAESLPPEPSERSSGTTSLGNRNRCSVPGILFNTNTLEGFHALDKQCLLKAEAKKVLCSVKSLLEIRSSRKLMASSPLKNLEHQITFEARCNNAFLKTVFAPINSSEFGVHRVNNKSAFKIQRNRTQGSF